MKTYKVKSISDDITITGKGENPVWKKANELTDFSYPWESGVPSFTSFKALHSESWLYCLFTADDRDIKIYVDTNDKTEAVRSDRIEIFMRKNVSMSPYYCLEIDATARVFDCKGEFHRKLDTSWSWPKNQLIAKSVQTADGYIVEVAISKRSLKDLLLINGNKIEAGLYRADCFELNGKSAAFRWISWIKPDSETPDFHIPSSFGVLELEE